MNEGLRAVGYWLADYYLAATLLLMLVFVADRLLKEPALRIAISWGAAVGLLLLVVIVSFPARPSFSLYNTDPVGLAGTQAEENLSELFPSTTDPNNHSVLDSSSTQRGDQTKISSKRNQALASSNVERTQSETEFGVGFSLGEALETGIVVFSTGSLMVVMWLCCGLIAVHKFRKECKAAPATWNQELERLAKGSRSPLTLLMNDSVGRAIVLGAWRPAIILPTEFLLQENPSAVRAVIGHELAHVEHKDLWLASLVRLLLPLLYVHPLFWWFRHQLLINQEYLADEVVASKSSRTEYAENLIRWARAYRRASLPSVGATLGLLENPRLLSQRVKVLLDDARPIATRVSRSWFRIAMAMSLGGAIVASLGSVRPNSDVAAREPSVLLTTSKESDSNKDALGTITGKVVDPDGKPLADVLVDAWTWCPGNETLTDESGLFRLTGIEPGKPIQVRFSKSGYSPQMFLNMEAGAADRNVALNQATYLDGRVVDQSGAGAAGTIVRANQGPKRVGAMVVQNIWSETKTDDQGRYRLFVQPDHYELEAINPDKGVAKVDSLAVAAGETRHLDLKLAKGATFHASVVDASTDEPARGVRFWAWKRPVVDALSDDSGIVHIENVPPGKYRLHFESDLYGRWWFESDTAEEREEQVKSDGWRREFDPRYLEITADMPTFKIFVERGVRISGRVVDPEGQAVEGATVAPVRTGTGNSLTGDTRYSVESDAAGKFAMLLPASGSAKYNLIAHDGKYQEWRRWANGAGKSLQTQPGDKVSDIKLELTRPGKIRGQVVGRDGKPIADREVFVRSMDGKGHRYYEPETKTASDGSFEMRYVQPGEQVVQLSPFLKAKGEKVLDGSSPIAIHSGKTVSGLTIVTLK